jgi:hypothetical protein
MFRAAIAAHFYAFLFLCTASTVIFPSHANAQLREAGVKAGGGNSTMIFFYGRCSAQGEPCVEYGQPHAPRRGVAAGMFLDFGVSRVLSIQPELLFVQKGFDVRAPVVNVLHLSYVEAPVLLRVDLRGHDAPGIRPFIYGGLAPALLTSCRISGTHVEGEYHGRCGAVEPSEVRANPRFYDLGLALGGGVKHHGLVMELRHTRGLIDNEVRAHAEQTTNRALTASVGYSVALRR